MACTPTDVYRYWQLLIDAADGVRVYEVHLFDPVEFTGAHGDLTGRDAADQHPADSVTLDPTGLIVTDATDVQEGFEDIDAYLAALSLSEPVEVVTSAGSTETIDYDTAHFWDITLTADCTLSITNPPADQTWGELVIILRQSSTAPDTVTWPAEVEWPDTDGTPGGAAPTLHTVDGAIDVVTLVTVDGGVTWGGSHDSASSAPTGAAGGDLSGTYPNPSVVDDSHSHTAATLPAATASSDHEHVDNIVFSGDGATTVWELPAAPVSETGIAVYVTGSRTIAWVLSGTMLTVLTFDAAPASAANNIVIDIVAAT